MSGDQLDLSAVEARAADAALTYSERWSQRVLREDVPALVAEVRRLRDEVRELRAAAGDSRYELLEAYERMELE